MEKYIEVKQVSVFRQGFRNKQGKVVMMVRPIKDTTIYQIYVYITGHWAQWATLKLREIKDHKAAQEFKKLAFRYFTPNGTFYHRRNAELKERSSYMVIDIDNLNDHEDVQCKKGVLLADEMFVTVLLFVSPSGLGLKWIIEVGDMDGYSHKEYFRAVSNYLRETYDIIVDQSGSDISRACYLPYDPECYINPQYIMNNFNNTNNLNTNKNGKI